MKIKEKLQNGMWPHLHRLLNPLLPKLVPATALVIVKVGDDQGHLLGDEAAAKQLPIFEREKRGKANEFGLAAQKLPRFPHLSGSSFWA